jgi:hypothetical protein
MLRNCPPIPKGTEGIPKLPTPTQKMIQNTKRSHEGDNNEIEIKRWHAISYLDEVDLLDDSEEMPGSKDKTKYVQIK